MAKDSKPSGKVGGQQAGRGSLVGGGAEFRVEDTVHNEGNLDLQISLTLDDENTSSNLSEQESDEDDAPPRSG